MGQVVGVYLADSAALPMRSVRSAVAAVGRGLLGGRYQAGTGQPALQGRGGLRAMILHGGRPRVGELVVADPAHCVTPGDQAADGAG